MCIAKRFGLFLAGVLTGMLGVYVAVYAFVVHWLTKRGV